MLILNCAKCATAQISFYRERLQSQHSKAFVTKTHLNAAEDMRGASSAGTKNTRKISALEDSSEKETITGKSVFSELPLPQV